MSLVIPPDFIAATMVEPLPHQSPGKMGMARVSPSTFFPQSMFGLLYLWWILQEPELLQDFTIPSFNTWVLKYSLGFFLLILPN